MSDTTTSLSRAYGLWVMTVLTAAIKRAKSMDRKRKALMRLIPLGVLMACLTTDNAAAQQLAHLGKLESAPAGVIVPLEELLRSAADTACVLTPYQSSLSGTDGTASQINAYLRSTNYQGDEGHWALILVNRGAISVQRFKRSTRLDLASGHESLPRRFAAKSCVPATSGAFIKTSAAGRSYVILGEAR